MSFIADTDLINYLFCSNLVSEGFPMDEICYQEDGEIFDDMDM